jgi:hypothetical protein
VRREHTFPLRLSDAEHDDLERRAAKGGIAKADVIREAMGWDPVGLIGPNSDPPPPRRSETTGKPVAEQGPGQRGLSLLTRRIAERGSRR